MLMFSTYPIETILVTLALGFLFSLTITASNPGAVRTTVLVTSMLALAEGIYASSIFNKADYAFQFASRYQPIPEYNLTFTLGVDGLSMIFLLLTLFIFPLLFLAAWSVTKYSKQFLNHLLGIEILLVLTFSTLDIFYFYVFFESLLIPMFILIGV